MIFIKRKTKEEKLNKEYSKIFKKVRREIVDLYRPINRKSKNLFLSKIDIMAYIMIGLFSSSAILFAVDNPFDYVPFLIGFCANTLFISYLEIKPLTWSEMYDYEKTYYRQLYSLPSDWEPIK
jgi:hypothetical protein